MAVADSLVATAGVRRLDGLVNNAAVLRDRTLAKMTPATETGPTNGMARLRSTMTDRR